MNDPSNEVVNAIYDALNGNTVMTVYSMPPADVDNFILIADYIGTEDSAKDNYMTRASITLEFVARYRAQGTKTVVNTDVDTVIGILRNAFASSITMSGFTNIVLTLDNVTDFIEEDTEYHIYRKIVRFNLIIEE